MVIIIAWKIRKSSYCRVFVKKLATILPIGKCFKSRSPYLTLSFMKKYIMLMCQVHLLLDELLFTSTLLALLLYWLIIVLFDVIHCTSRNYQIHSICGIMLSMPNNSSSEDLFVFILCL